MSDDEKLPTIDASMLADAFPAAHRPSAMRAGRRVAWRLRQKDRISRFSAQVENQTVQIPERLYFASESLWLTKSDEAWLFARALQTRNADGFLRQRAVRDLLIDFHPWGAPFIVKLIGEYVVEILEDVSAAMTPDLEQALGEFIVQNPRFWNTTKRRVTSYWNVYYRARWLHDIDRAEQRDEYVGFRLIQRLEMSASRCISKTAK